MSLSQPDDALLGGYDIDQQVGFLLRRAHQRHVSLFQVALADPGLTPAQFSALVKIVLLGHVTQNQLGRLISLDPATMAGVVRRLIARGLVSRRADPADRRAGVLHATTDGVVLAERAVAQARHATDATLAPLTCDERRQILILLHKMA